MTTQDIEKLCPRAERITIYDDGSVSFRVGDFAQSVNPGSLKDPTAWQPAVRNMYSELCNMNRQVEEQEKKASANTQLR